MRLKEQQIWRKHGPRDWLKILQILDPEYPGYDSGLHGARVLCYPPQMKGIQCRGGEPYFIGDVYVGDDVVTWERQITDNRFLLINFVRGAKL